MIPNYNFNLSFLHFSTKKFVILYNNKTEENLNKN